MDQVLKVAPAVTCQLLWLSPMPTMLNVKKNKTTAGLPPLAYYSMFANGYMWLVYGLITRSGTMIAANLPGMLFGLYYSYTFLKYNSGQFNMRRYNIIAGMMVMFVSVIATFPSDIALPSLGYLGVLISMAMFGGPLQVIHEVWKAKSTKSLPFPMAMATIANCILWSAFGLRIAKDPFIWAPNLLGLSSGVAQLLLFIKFGITKVPAKAQGM